MEKCEQAFSYQGPPKIYIERFAQNVNNFFKNSRSTSSQRGTRCRAARLYILKAPPPERTGDHGHMWPCCCCCCHAGVCLLPPSNGGLGVVSTCILQCFLKDHPGALFYTKGTLFFHIFNRQAIHLFFILIIPTNFDQIQLSHPSV